jgi:arylsulfatase A-like enzyme
MSLVLIVADSVRHDAFGCGRAGIGGREPSPFALPCLPQTPTVDRLAEQGVFFERTISSAPWTLPSLGSMLTGVYAHRLGLARWDQPWPSDYENLFGLARQAGCEVASFVFDPDHLFSRVPDACVRGSSQDTESMLAWLRAHRHQQFFALIHYWWTHIPYVDQPMSTPAWRLMTDEVLKALRAGPAARAGVQRLYGHAVERMSEVWLPKVLEAVDLDRCFISIIADHGESWGERSPESLPEDVFDLHGNALHEEVLRVPWIIRPPGGIRGRRIAELVRNVDVMPTLASLAAWKSENWPSDLDGIDLAGALSTGSVGQSLDAISVRNHDCITTSLRPTTPRDLYSAIALTGPRWRQVWEPSTDRWQAFDLESDPAELCDLGKPPELAAGAKRLEAELARARVGEFLDDNAAEVASRLRQWGYLE